MMAMIFLPGLILERVEQPLRRSRKVGGHERRVFLEHHLGVAVRLVERPLEGGDAVAAEGVILRQHADRDVVLAERDRRGKRVLRGIAAAAEDVAVPFIAGDGIGDRGLDQKNFLRILGDRQHGERRAG